MSRQRGRSSECWHWNRHNKSRLGSRSLQINPFMTSSCWKDACEWLLWEVPFWSSRGGFWRAACHWCHWCQQLSCDCATDWRWWWWWWRGWLMSTMCIPLVLMEVIMGANTCQCSVPLNALNWNTEMPEHQSKHFITEFNNSDEGSRLNLDTEQNKYRGTKSNLRHCLEFGLKKNILNTVLFLLSADRHSRPFLMHKGPSDVRGFSSGCQSAMSWSTALTFFV